MVAGGQPGPSLLQTPRGGVSGPWPFPCAGVSPLRGQEGRGPEKALGPSITREAGLQQPWAPPPSSCPALSYLHLSRARCVEVTDT